MYTPCINWILFVFFSLTASRVLTAALISPLFREIACAPLRELIIPPPAPVVVSVLYSTEKEAWLGVFVLSIPVLIYAGIFSMLTPTGEEQSVRWKGLAEYLKQVSKGKEPAISPDYFERYLAYATVFGLGANWAKYFQQLGGVPLPIWFHAIAGGDGDFGAIVAVSDVGI